MHMLQNTDIFRTCIRIPNAILDSRIGIWKKFWHHFVQKSYLSHKSIQVGSKRFGSTREKIGLGGFFSPQVTFRGLMYCWVTVEFYWCSVGSLLSFIHVLLGHLWVLLMYCWVTVEYYWCTVGPLLSSIDVLWGHCWVLLMYCWATGEFY